MVALKHPNVAGLTVDKPHDQVRRWEKAGWLRVEPTKNAAAKTTEKQDDKPTEG